MKRGVDMIENQFLQTDLNLRTSLTWRFEKISSITSSGSCICFPIMFSSFLIQKRFGYYIHRAKKPKLKMVLFRFW